MNNETVLSRIDALSERLLLAQPSDLDVLAAAHTEFEAFADWADDQSMPVPRQAMIAVAALIEQIILGDVADPADGLSTVGEALAAFQMLVRDGRTVDEVRFPESLISQRSPAPQVAEKSVAAVVEPVPIAVEPVPAPRASKLLEADPDLLREFISEAKEHLDNADIHLLTIETNPRDTDALNAVFRAFHTIKGVAGFLSLEDVQALAHEAENLLDKARKGDLELSQGYLDITFDSVDMMKKLIGHVEHALTSGVVLHSEETLGAVVLRVKAAVSGQVVPGTGMEPTTGVTGKKVGELLVESGLARKSVVEQAIEAQDAVGSLPLGELLVREVIITRAQLNQALDIQAHSVGHRKLGELLVEMGAACWDDIEACLSKQQLNEKTPIGELLVRQGEVAAKDVAQALRVQRQKAAPVEMKEAVKVDADRLDRLIDLIGELVIAESMVSQSREIAGASQQLSRQLNQLDKITRELQEMGMSLRMVPVRATFQKMARLVRDVAKKAGKRVDFVTEGEDTELDKTVVDKIGDPLIHMVRNAVDHGLEATSDDRVEQGKPESGRVTLRAFHKGGSIYIEIQDDGRGLNRDAILAKGRERGLIRDGEIPSDRDLFNLIFEPGFSTAKQITDVSGRGVGMDVVRRNIDSLRGQIEIQSEVGKGSVFSIRLPLTLAIIDGMVVRVGHERYVVPTLSVVRSIKLEPEQLSSVVGRGEMIALQGELIPLFRLHKLFEIPNSEQDPLKALVLILEDEGKHVGLLIDELLGQQQIVIKSLGESLKGLDGLAGAAIMSDGTVGLIVDVGGIVKITGDVPSSDGDNCQSAA